MKILLDECMPARFFELLIGHEVDHVTKIGWSGIKNGELLKRASEKYDVLLTVDYALPTQLTEGKVPLPVLVLHGQSNKLKHIRMLDQEVLKLLSKELSPSVYRLGV